MRLSQHQIDYILETCPVGRLATLGADGIPDPVPIVFARAGARLWSPIDGKPKAGRELGRVRNIEARPGVSILFDHYADDWSQLWWLRIDALAEVVRPGASERSGELAAAVSALRDKYPQYRHTELLPEPATLLALSPTAHSSWCASAGADFGSDPR